MTITQQPNHNLTKYFEMCTWAGLPTRTMSMQAIYLAAGQIIQHTSIQRHITGLSPVELLQKLEPVELADLRAKIKWDEDVESAI